MFIFLANRIIFDVIFVLLIILSRRNRNGVTSSFRKFVHSHRYSTREFLRLRDSGTAVAFTFDFWLPVFLRLSQFSRLYATEGTIWNAGDARTRVLSGAKNEVLFGNRKRERVCMCGGFWTTMAVWGDWIVRREN